MQNNNQNKLVYLAMTVAMLFWGFSFIATKFALQEIPPISVVGIRLFFASMMMLILLFFTRKNNPLPPLKELPFFMLLGFLNPAATFLLESNGMLTVSASLSSLIMATLPLLTPLAAFFILKERFTLFNVLGLIISFLGVGLILLSKQLSVEYTGLGVFFLSAAVLCSIFYSILARHILRKYTALTVVGLQQTFGFLFLLPLFLLREAKSLFATPPPFPNLLAVFALALFASTLSYSLYNYGLKNLGTTKANAFINITPVITTVASYFILGELLSVEKILGMILVILGLFLAQGKKRVTLQEALGKSAG